MKHSDSPKYVNRRFTETQRAIQYVIGTFYSKQNVFPQHANMSLSKTLSHTHTHKHTYLHKRTHTHTHSHACTHTLIHTKNNLSHTHTPQGLESRKGDSCGVSLCWLANAEHVPRNSTEGKFWMVKFQLVSVCCQPRRRGHRVNRSDICQQ